MVNVLSQYSLDTMVYKDFQLRDKIGTLQELGITEDDTLYITKYSSIYNMQLSKTKDGSEAIGYIERFVDFK